MKNRIAIVIPVYKNTHLLETLVSIGNQTDKRFNLYICNDNSPYEVEPCIKTFGTQYNIPFKYIKYEENWGEKNLVAQWERCINEIKDEEWIWLFSDDDIMDCFCVAEINDYLDKNPKEDILHFNIDIIGNKGEIIKEAEKYPLKMSSSDFLNIYT